MQLQRAIRSQIFVEDGRMQREAILGHRLAVFWHSARCCRLAETDHVPELGMDRWDTSLRHESSLPEDKDHARKQALV